MTDLSYKTAITRNNPSAPMKYLSEQGKLRGRVLDYGSGKGKDVEVFQTEQYDPHFSPELPRGAFDTITCNYVLNVVDNKTSDEIIKTIKSKLAPGGTAYITVRRDIKSERITKLGTYQRNVILGLPIMIQTSGYCIYYMTN